MPDLLSELRTLRLDHPGWRLLCQLHAHFVVAVLHQTFLAESKHQVPESAFLSVITDHLEVLRLLPEEAPTQRPEDYLGKWLEARFIRRSYRPGDQEPVIDLTPAAHRAIEWVMALRKRSTFVGTESRLRTIVDLMSQVRSGSEENPQAHLDRLLKQRAEIEQDIIKLRNGEVPHRLDPLQIRDRLQQVRDHARLLLTDLREVDQNFRSLDQDLRSRIATWDAPKGKLLSEVFGTSDSIKTSDQGRSFDAFWEYLMSPERQEEFRALLKAAISVGLIDETGDSQMRYIEREWLLAARQVQQTVGQLSAQLRRFLDDRIRGEHRRIMQLINAIERSALGLQKTDGFTIEFDAADVVISLPMTRQMASTAEPVTWLQDPVQIGVSDDPATALHDLVHVDRAALRKTITTLLDQHHVVGLSHIIEAAPLQYGLAELIAYFDIAAESDAASIDDSATELVSWVTGDICRQAKVPKLLFWRSSI